MKNIPNRLSMPRQLTKTVVCLLLILLLIAIYGQIRHHDYIHYDDHLLVINNLTTTQPLTVENVFHALSTQPQYFSYKIPLTTITHMLKWHFFGNDMGLHHLISLFFHALTVVLLFLLLIKTTGKTIESGLAAGLVAVHPINAEAVCWLANINTIMADFFLVATLLAYAYYTKKPEVRRYLILFVPFVLGLMSKPTMVVGPLLMLTLDYWPLKRFQTQTGPKNTADDSPPPAGLIKQLAGKTGRMFLLIEKLPFLLIALSPYLLEFLNNPDKLITGVRAGGDVHPQGLPYIFWPLLKAVMPTNLTIGRAHPAAASLVEAGFFLLLLALVTGAVVWLSRRRPWIGFGWLWYLAAILPVIVMMIGSGRPMADRHAYLPLAGIFITVSYLAGDALKKKPYGRPVFVILAALVLGILTALSFSQVRHWQNSRTVFEHAVRINPDNPRARVNLGDVYLRAGQIDRAIAQYQAALDTGPDQAPDQIPAQVSAQPPAQSPEKALIHTKLAYAFSVKEDIGQARQHYEQALRLNPDYAAAHHNLADLLAGQGRTDEAISHYYLALQADPRAYQTHNNLAALLSEQGRHELARQHLYQALRIKPDYETARENLNNLPVSP